MHWKYYVTIHKLFEMITLSQDELIIEASILYVRFVVTDYNAVELLASLEVVVRLEVYDMI